MIKPAGDLKLRHILIPVAALCVAMFCWMILRREAAMTRDNSEKPVSTTARALTPSPAEALPASVQAVALTKDKAVARAAPSRKEATGQTSDDATEQDLPGSEGDPNLRRRAARLAAALRERNRLIDASRAASSAPPVSRNGQTDASTSPAAEDPSLPVQSAARPYGLQIAAPVRMPETDAAATAFQAEVLPEILEYLEDSLLPDPKDPEALTPMPPEGLVLAEPADVRVYFVAEDAKFHNSIGIMTDDGASLIFPDASSIESYTKDDAEGRSETGALHPLLAGDFVDIGRQEAGTFLDLFMISDGARRDAEIFGSEFELNVDGQPHMMLHGIIDGRLLLIGFEDMPKGGDRDYTDVMIAVDVGEANAGRIVFE